MATIIPARTSFWYEKPLSPTTTPFQANATPSRMSRRPSVIKGTIYAHNGAFRSRYGAHPAIKGAFCHERVPFSHMAAPFQADTVSLPSAKAPSWYEKRSSRPWRCPSKQIRRPPAINGALRARTSALLLTTAPFEAKREGALLTRKGALFAYNATLLRDTVPSPSPRAKASFSTQYVFVRVVMTAS